METYREVARQRKEIYAFLAALFREELKAEQITAMLESGIIERLNDAGCNIDINAFLDKPIDRIEEELAVEFTRIFIGPGKHVVPYESIYVPDQDGRVGYYWGECTVDVKNWVEHYGLKISEMYDSIPDHVSIELEFMEKVIELEEISWRKGDNETALKCLEVERTFFNKHIIKWVPHFCERVQAAAELDFYREIAGLTKDFILEEERLLNEERIRA